MAADKKAARDHQRQGRNQDRSNSRIGGTVREEVHYALNDIRNTWEKAWFGEPTSQTHWQGGVGQSEGRGSQPETKGMFQSFIDNHPNNQHGPEHSQGLGIRGDDQSNWEAAKQAAHEFYDRQKGQSPQDDAASEERLANLEASINRHFSPMNQVPAPKEYPEPHKYPPTMGRSPEHTPSGEVLSPASYEQVYGTTINVEPYVEPVTSDYQLGKHDIGDLYQMEPLQQADLQPITREDLYGQDLPETVGMFEAFQREHAPMQQDQELDQSQEIDIDR